MKTKEQIEMLAIKSSEKRSLENRDYRIGFEDGYKMAGEKSKLLFAFRDYWQKSSHQNINEAIKGFLRTKKSKQ